MGKLYEIIKSNYSLVLSFAFLGLAFGLRYHFLTAYPYPLMIHEQDGVAYMNLAKELLGLNLANYSLPPFYPAVIAFFSFLPVNFEYAARLASITMDALSIIPLYYISGKYLGFFGRCSVCILWAFCSFSLYFTVSPLSQSSYLFCLLAGVALLYKGLEEENTEVWLSASGICFAFAYLARIEGIIGFSAGLFLCFVPFLRKEKPHRKKIEGVAFYICGFLAGAGPYLVYLHGRVGYWTISVRGEQELKTPDAVNTLNAAGTLAKNAARGLSIWTKNFGSFSEFIAFAGNNAKGYFAVYAQTFPVWVHLISIAGLILLFAHRKWRRSIYLLLLPLAIAPIFFLNIPKTHSYFYPLFPFVFICFVSGAAGAIDGIGYVVGKFTRTEIAFTSRKSAGFLLLIPVIVLAHKFYGDADRSFQDPGLVQQAILTDRIYRDAGEFIKNSSRPGEPVLTRWGLVSYYADRPLMILPKGAVREVVAFARKNGARYMVIDSVSVYSRRQELEELLNPLMGKMIDPAYGLKVFHMKLDREIGQGYVIYTFI